MYRENREFILPTIPRFGERGGDGRVVMLLMSFSLAGYTRLTAVCLAQMVVLPLTQASYNSQFHGEESTGVHDVAPTMMHRGKMSRLTTPCSTSRECRWWLKLRFRSSSSQRRDTGRASKTFAFLILRHLPELGMIALPAPSNRPAGFRW